MQHAFVGTVRLIFFKLQNSLKNTVVHEINFIFIYDLLKTIFGFDKYSVHYTGDVLEHAYDLM